MNPDNTNETPLQNGTVEAQSVHFSAWLDALKEDVDRKLKELADKYVGTNDPHLAAIYNAKMEPLEWVLARMQDQASNDPSSATLRAKEDSK